MADLEKIRIDKWLWYARFFKTRTLATSLAGQGRIRVNGDKISKASVTVKTGDVLTFPKDNHIRVIEILALGARRGPASEAQSLYLDLQPPRLPINQKTLQVMLILRAHAERPPHQARTP